MTAPLAMRSATTPVPWLSALALTAALLFSIHARIEGAAVRGHADAALAEAGDYFLEHPYLEPGPVLAGRFPSKAVARARRSHELRRLENGWLATPERVVRHQQAELEARVEAALADVADLPARDVAVVPAQGLSAAWLRYPLLHTSSWQLLGNGILLLFLGLYLERSFGRAGFAALALSVTLAGAAAWQLTAPGGASHGLVGAGPPLAGLLGAFALRFLGQRDEGFYAVGCVMGLLWLALPPWAALDGSRVAVALVASDPEPPATALYPALLAAALVGGCGAFAAWLFGIDGERYTERDSEVTRSPRFRRAMRAREAGRPREAMEMLVAYLNDVPDAYEAALALHRLSADLGRTVETRSALLRLIRIELKRELSAPAVGHWLELSEDGIPEDADPALLVHVALLLREEGRGEEAVHALRCALERSDDAASHETAVRIARAARGLDPGVVESAAWRALGAIELELPARQAVENLIAEALDARRGGLALAPAREDPVDAPPAGVGVLPEAPAAVAVATPIDIDTETRALDAVVAVPLQIAEDGIEVQTLEGQKKLVRFERIDAVAVAAVEGLAAKPVLLVDLVLDWMSPVNETLRVIRLRGDCFDPRRLFPGHSSSVDALRSLVKIAIERSDAIALPDPEAAAGRPFASFPDPESYQRGVLLVEEAVASREPEGVAQGRRA